MRVVTTNLTLEKDLCALDSVLGQMSDGIWENSPRMEAIWKHVDIDRKDDGKIEFKITAGPMCYDTIKWTDDAIRKYFATKIKQIVKKEAEWGRGEVPEWKRTCKTELAYFHPGLRVCDVYKTYDLLLGRPAHEYAN